MRFRLEHRRAVTLTELLCVMGILGILAGLYLPSVIRSFLRVKHFLFGE